MLTKFPFRDIISNWERFEVGKKVIHCNISQNIAICLKIAISYCDIGIVIISDREASGDSHPYLIP